MVVIFFQEIHPKLPLIQVGGAGGVPDGGARCFDP